MAAALFAAWSGDQAIVVASPPGAGKTRLVVHLAHELHRRADLRIAIAAQTRIQAIDVVNRAAALGGPAALLGARDSSRPPTLAPKAAYPKGTPDLSRWRGVVVATTARWLWVNERTYTADLCITDEAWQMTYADLGALGPLSAQIVLVGDPGQIAPVVTGDTRHWQDLVAGPHRPAPEALVATYSESVTRLRLSQTWRLGPVTTALIQPTFYPDLPFTSARPARWIEIRGAQVGELAVRTVATRAGPGDAALASAAADRVCELVADGILVDSDGVPRSITPLDVAVITPHVEQASAIAARLRHLPDVLIGTANQMQGLERDCVVVVHPLAGYRDTPSFATDPGRLCVALSRHRTHATVIIDAETDAVLRRARHTAAGDRNLALQQRVLQALLHVPA